jgi:hypothetical protein
VAVLAAVGIAWLAIWIIVTVLRARVVRFFEEHDEDGALMRYHNSVECSATPRVSGSSLSCFH